MSETPFKRHYTTYLAYTLVNVLVSYALLLFLANRLTPDDYALFALISSIAGVGLIVLNAGHKESLFKFESQSDLPQLVWLSGSLKPWLVLATVLGAVLLGVELLWGLAAFSFTGVYLFVLCSGLFRGRGWYHRDAATWPLYRLVWLASLLCLTLFGALSLGQVFVASIFASGIVLLCLNGASHLWALLKLGKGFNVPFSNPTLRRFFWLELATVAYLKIDIILLTTFGAPAHDIAGYFFALQIFEAAMLGLSPLAYLFFNRVNALGYQQDLSASVAPFWLIAMLMSLLILLGWWGLGEFVLAQMFPVYVSRFDLTLWLLLVLFPMALSMLLSHWLFAHHQEGVYAKICFAGLAACTTANVFLIPLYGVYGAAWSRLVTELVILCLLLLYIALRPVRAAGRAG